MARNRLIDHLRTHKTLGELPPEDDEPAPLASLTACLPRALSEMPEEDRKVLELCDLEGMPQAEYACVKGIGLPAQATNSSGPQAPSTPLENGLPGEVR